MPFIEAAIIAVAEEAAAAAAAEAAAAAAAETAAAAAAETAAAAAAEGATATAAEAAATAAATDAATAAATTAAADTGAGAASGAIGEGAAQGIAEAAPELLAQAAPETGGVGASGIAEAAPEVTQELAAQGAEATQAAATDVAQGTAQQPAGLEQVAPQQPAGMQQAAPQQPAGIEQIQPPAQQPSADQLAQELQSQIQQTGQQPLQPSPYEPTASTQGTTDVGGQNLVEKPTTTPTPEGIQVKPGESVTDALMRAQAAGNEGVVGGSQAGYPGTETNPFFQGMDKAMKYAPLAVLGAGVIGGMSSNQGSQPFPSTSYNGPLNKYKLSGDFKGSQATPQVYKPTYAAEGGIMQVGPVERMTQNSIGENQMYPQGQQIHTQFATPTQMPTSAEVVRSSYEQPTNPYTGQEITMASGGLSKNKVPKDFESQFDYFAGMMEGERAAPTLDRGDVGIYYDNDPETKYKDALSATLIRQKKMDKKAGLTAPKTDIKPVTLGAIKTSPANVKDEKGGSSDEDEFASGGIAQIKKYASGGYAPNKYSGTPTLAAPRTTTRTEYTYDESGQATPYQVVDTYQPSQSLLASNFQRGADVAPQRYAATYDDVPAGIIAAAPPRQTAAERFSGRMPAMGGRTLESRFGGRMPAMAAGGQAYSLGGYADGGNPRLLRGPGDGMSDNIPATIGGKQPARLADGEFVLPADVVSALGNGSTDAGARELHAMMDRIRQAAHGKKTQQRKVNAKKAMVK